MERNMSRTLLIYGRLLIIAMICIVVCHLVRGMFLRSVFYLMGQAFAMYGGLAVLLRVAPPNRARNLPLIGLASVALLLAVYVVVGRPRNNHDLPFLLSLDSLRLALAALVGLVTVAGGCRPRWSFADIGVGLTLLAMFAMALSDATGRSHYLTGVLILECTPLAPGFDANKYGSGELPVLVIVPAAALACGTMVAAALRRRDPRAAGGALATACMLAASLISDARSPHWWRLFR